MVNPGIRNQVEHARKQAKEAYDQFRASTGRADLDARTSARITEYCTEALGSPDFQPWMRFYALYQERFVEGWIPDDFFGVSVLPRLYARRRPIVDKRTLSRRLFQSDAFPDIAYFINGQWFTHDYQILAADQLLNHIFAETPEVYVKLEGSGRGRGVHRLRRMGFEDAVRSLPANAVVQRPIEQHPWFDRISPQAATTIRITTSYLDSSGARFRASHLRVPGPGEELVTHAHSLRCAVIDDEGSLSAEALDAAWRLQACHPGTGFVFRDSQIPFFKEAVATCVRLHNALPHDPIVGWDVGITPTGKTEVMEWNSGHAGIKFAEATVGPCFADCSFSRMQPSK
jgi:hypothetical protein